MTVGQPVPVRGEHRGLLGAGGPSAASVTVLVRPGCCDGVVVALLGEAEAGVDLHPLAHRTINLGGPRRSLVPGHGLRAGFMPDRSRVTRNRRTSVSYRAKVAAKDTMTSAAYFAGIGACQRPAGL